VGIRKADFCPACRRQAGQSKVSVRIFLEIGSDFIQERQHFDKLSVSRPAREFFSWDFVFTLAFSF